MNVQFKVMRRSGDKAYILSEITGYNDHLPVVLAASTESGARIPSDAFPYCNDKDPIAVESVLADAALASNRDVFSAPHSKNTAGVRFFVVVLPWMNIRRWVLEFKAIDSAGNTVERCTKKLDLESVKWFSRLDSRINQAQSMLIEQLDGRFIHDRIHISFVRAFKFDDQYMVSALLEMPYHEESVIEVDYLGDKGQALFLDSYLIEDSVTHVVDQGFFERRYMMVSFLVKQDYPEVCLCATDTAGSIAPGFAMLGQNSLNALLEDFEEKTTSAYNDKGYHTWFKRYSEPDVPTLLEQVSLRFNHEPLISVVCPLADAPTHHLYDVVSSMLMQSYGKWELILVGASSDGGLVSDLISSFDDERVYVLDVSSKLSFAEQINAGLLAAEGEFVGVIRACNKVAPHALFEYVRVINEYPDCDLTYSDSDSFDTEGIHSHPIFRPSFSPELLRCCYYLEGFYLIRSTLLLHVGLLRKEFTGALGYDLALRCTEAARRVCHVPRVLYHVRYAYSYTEDDTLVGLNVEAGRRALVEHCKRVGITAEVRAFEEDACYQIRHVLVTDPHVVIVVPTEDNAEVFASCIRSIYSKTTYCNFEVVAVVIGNVEEKDRHIYDDLQHRYDNFSLLRWEEEFNRARVANYAASQTAGEFLLFLNDDTKVLTQDALQVLLGYFQLNNVGVVGPRQLFVDGTIEHAGLVLGGARVITPLSRYLPVKKRVGFYRSNVAQNLSAVTGDCMMVRRSAFEEVNGFTESFTMYCSDVDFCLKVQEKGYYTVYTPYVDLSHFRSVSRIRNYSKALRIKKRKEAALLQYLWPRYFAEGDVFYNPNLDPDSSYFALKRLPKNAE